MKLRKPKPFYLSTTTKITADYPNGEWNKREYDRNGRLIKLKTSYGYWARWEYDKNGNDIYYENSNGDIIDKRDK